MSFNAKNLTYDSNEPTFLRKLKSQYGGSDYQGARQERPIGRPRKSRNEDGDDDEPTYVDGDSNDTITKAQYDDLLKRSDPVVKDESKRSLDVTEDDKILDETQAEEASRKETVATIGASGKKRQVKAVAMDNSEVSEGEKNVERPPKKEKRRPPAKKAKKVKLSFDEDV